MGNARTSALLASGVIAISFGYGGVKRMRFPWIGGRVDGW